MPHFLGIDYGTKIIGVSIATTPLAEPLTILENQPEAILKIGQLCDQEHIDALVVGVSEGEMAQKSREFGKQLARTLNLPVHYQDETLTSHQANQNLSHAKKSRRAKPQDAYQATVMLQEYLDAHPPTFESLDGV